MSELANQHSLVDELDARQNMVILQLDDLNTQIESLLTDYLGVDDTPNEEGPPETTAQEAA